MPIKTSVTALIFCLSVTGCVQQQTGNHMPSPAAIEKATDLSFNAFYKSSVGPLGLEPSAKLLSLNGKRVHIRGLMVLESAPVPGLLMLTPVPVNIPETEDGAAADDLPGATVYVHLPSRDADKIPAYRPGLWDFTGILQLGAKEEANGRVSYLRLSLEQDANLPTTVSKPE